MATKKALGRNFYSLLEDNMMEESQAAKTTIKISRITPVPQNGVWISGFC